MKELELNRTYFFADHEVRVIKQFPPFNLAIVEDIHTLKQMKADMNFIRDTKKEQFYIKFK